MHTETIALVKLATEEPADGKVEPGSIVTV